VLFKVVLF